jgi:outer membrane immunogenic protein
MTFCVSPSPRGQRLSTCVSRVDDLGRRTMKISLRKTIALPVIVGVLSGPMLTSAKGADLPAKAPVVNPAYSWTGFYIGGTVGGAWNTNKVRLDALDAGAPAYFGSDAASVSGLGSDNLKRATVIFGGKIGYNQQLSSNWLIGLEADISSMRFRQSVSKTGSPYAGFGGFATFHTEVSTDWLATIRPRVGYAFGRGLIYATGGVAFGNQQFSNTYRDLAPFGLFFGNAASSASSTRAGWALGAGLDYAVTNNWIVSVEYLHVDLGKISTSATVVDGNGPTNGVLNFSSRLESDIVRVGVAYKFGGPVGAYY